MRRWKSFCWPPSTSSTGATPTSCSANGAFARTKTTPGLRLPLATVPYLHDKSHLPVVVDPSHGTGKSRLVVPMARASIAAGADGLIIEVHDDPEHAVSDGAQTITPAAFKQLMDQCRRSPKPWIGRCEKSSVCPNMAGLACHTGNVPWRRKRE